MKRYVCTIIAVICSIFAIASNTLSLSSVSGTPQTEVEVVVSLDNTDAITALEMVLPLGEHLSYVDGSATLATARSNGHQLSAAQVGQDLRIYVYSLSLNAIPGNTGELLTFRLLLGSEPADYALTPTVVLSNAQGTSIDGSVQAGNVTIQAPKLQIVNPQIDYGHIPIRATYTKNLQLKNVGNLPLTIENITTTDPLLVPKQTTLTIEAGQTTSVAIEYTPTERGAVSAEAIVKSNAINGEQVVTIMADPFSVNELHVGTASGIADSLVTISLTMNNMESIVAMQCAFKLPKQLEYVANSLAVNTTRTNGHQALSTLRGDTLFLAIFSMTNQPLHANDGEVATFQLRLNGSSGTYYLKPIDVVLSNITEENMVSATSQGSVRINAPSISSNASLSFGNIPITEVAYATYSVRNNGSAPLVLERATFLAEGYSIVEELPITIANYQTTTITVAYQPTEEGDFSTTMNLYTNDPNNRLKTVALSGHVFEPNTLTLDGHNNQDGTYTLSVALENYTDIVAVQYDLHWRSDMTTLQAAFTLSERIKNHSYSITPLGNDSYRVLIYSMSNATIAGHEGELHQLVFTPQGEANYCGSTISVDNIVLSNAAGHDKASTKSASLHAEQTQWANDSAIACDQYVWNGKTYTQSGMYIDTIPSALGCDSIVTLHLTINNTQYVEESIVACDSYTWNGETYTESGEYVYTTTATNGCDSIVTLHLTINNTQYAEESIIACDSYAWNGQTYTESGEYVYNTTAANGCDSIVTLHLTINQTQYAEETIVACDSYAWNGQTYTQSGDYVYTTTSTNGCDSIVTLHLTINNTQYAEESVVACDSYTWNGETYTQGGEYVYTTVAANGCDSVVILHLTVNPIATTEEKIVACDSYEWNGQTYTESGDYTYTTVAANGCDSIVTLHLTINNSEIGETEYVTICYGETYTWNGQTYSTEGEYSITLSNTLGCDSVATLHLTIMPEATTTTETVVIGSDELPYTWRGNTYSATGQYTVVEQYTSIACDSAIHVLDLTVLTTGNHDEQSVTICETEAPYTWYGESYSATGKYTYTEKYAGTDIDSIQHILNLTVNPTVYTEEHITACDSYTWNGETYTQSGDYVYTTTAANGCDSIVTLHLTINKTQYAEVTATACDSYVWNSETYTQSGDYTYTTVAANGCDSIVTLHLTINKSEYVEESVTACDSYEWHGVVYAESGDYTYTTTTNQGCERVEVLHLTILPDAMTESEELALCPSELPYEWYGQWLTEAGSYTATEQYAGMDCDSIIHELIVNIYVQTLPAVVTLPIVRTGEAIDVTIPTAEIQAHIAAETWYAPNAEVAWYIMENSDWAALTADPVKVGTTQVVLKYAVATDCGSVESDNMVIDVIPTSVENTHSQSPTSDCQKFLYEDHIYILRDGKIYSIMGQEM